MGSPGVSEGFRLPVVTLLCPLSRHTSGRATHAIMGRSALDPVPTTFDAHCHLQDLPPGEVTAALDRACLAGVSRLVCCATSEADWGAVLALAEAHPQVLPMLGIHPWMAAETRTGWESRLEILLVQHRVGIGECGLDFARRPLDRDLQLDVFRRHLRLAAKLRRPVTIHCVRAWGALKHLLIEEGLPPAGTMIHAFSGSAETARELQERGFLLSFSGRLTDPSAARVRSALMVVDDDHLLLESDAPGQAAREPAVLPSLLEAAATLRRCSITHLAGITLRNGERFFREAMA